MRYLACVLLCVAACGTDSGAPAPDPGPVTEVSGDIAANTTWIDTIHITAATTIAAGVMVTVAPGTVIEVASGIAITVNGTLDVQGAKGDEVHMHTASPDVYFADVHVAKGGVLLATYYIQDHGAMSIASTGTATITDSRFSFAGGDFLTMSGGRVDISYSSFGLEPGRTDHTHCDMHLAQPLGVTITHTNISTAAYALMEFGGTNLDFRYDNWFENFADIGSDPGMPVSADVSFGWFQKGAPSAPGFTANNLASARLADAGPR